MLALIIDTETTGPDPETCALLEVAWATIDCTTGALLHCESYLVDFDGDVGPTEVHGITSEMPGFGLPVEQVANMLRDTVYGLSPDNAPAHLIAHNAKFDRRVLERHGLKPGLPWICTYEQLRWPGLSRVGRLVDVALHYGVGVTAAHRAINDVLTLQRALERVAERHDLAALITQAAADPVVEVEAVVSFAEKDKAKAAGFRWEPEAKRWVRRMRASDVAGLGFATRVVS